jgi:hypothetical protein
MTLKPAVVLRLVGVEIVENDMDLPVRVLSLNAPAAAVMLGADLAAGCSVLMLSLQIFGGMFTIILQRQYTGAPQVRLCLLLLLG